MAMGPLDTFVFPGVLVRTINEAAGANAAGDIRFPAFIGVSAEEIRVSDFEMVRGSSAISDNLILDEDETSQFTGTNNNFTVANFPIVIGDGSGKAATSPNSVIVTVNAEKVAVNSVNGLTGEVTLVRIPKATDEVRANYYFKRRDTYIEGEDLDSQADGSTKTFKVNSARIVKGDNGGRNATDTDITATTNILYDPNPLVPGDEYWRTVRVFQVKVNNTEVTVDSLDGADGLFTLAVAPTGGDTVRVTYFTNNWQDTYDVLPAAKVNRVVKVGLSQDTSDFSVGEDCVLSGENRLHWGTSYQVSAGLYTAGSTPLAGNVVAGLTDTKVYGQEATVVTSDLSGKTYALPTTPCIGDGTGKPTENPALVTAYVGADWLTALTAGPVVVIKVSGVNVTLATAPLLTDKVFVTYYDSLITDDNWLVTNEVPGGVGVGKYTITSTLHGNALDVVQSSGTYVPASGQFFVQVDPLLGSVERVTVLHDGVDGFTVSSLLGPTFTLPGRTGSGAVNTGKIGQTYIDEVTGFRLTYMASQIGVPTVGQTSVYDLGDPTVSNLTQQRYITAKSSFMRGIPGINLTVATTSGGAVDNTGDTVFVYTYNKSGNEPNVGDFYYVTFDKTKTDYTTKFLTTFRDVTKYFGPLDINNQLTLAANLAFLNGAQAVALKQIKRQPNQGDASVNDYIAGIDAFNEPLPNGLRPTLIQPLSTDANVHTYLKSSNAIQCSIRYRNERTSIIGFDVGTSSDEVISRVQGIASEKITAVYPDGAIIGINDTYGNEVEYIVSGAFIAAAIAGRDVSPASDIATPLTNATITGFKRLYRRLDNVTAALVANAGCTVLEEQTPIIRILMYLSTDVGTVLTRDPRIVEVKHFIQQGIRKNLNNFIGQKNLPKLRPQIREAVNAYFRALKQGEIIVDFTGVNVTPDQNDPTTVNVEAYYSPVFPLNWIVVTLNLRSSL